MKIHMKKGDTLYLLSQKYNVALDKLIAANPQIADPDKLDIGMKVKIPAQPVTPKPEGVLHSHKVVQGDSLWKLSQAWGVPLKDMINANPQLKTRMPCWLERPSIFLPCIHKVIRPRILKWGIWARKKSYHLKVRSTRV